MKNLISTASLIMTLIISQPAFSQKKRIPASFGRAEYIEVEPGVRILPILAGCFLLKPLNRLVALDLST